MFGLVSFKTPAPRLREAVEQRMRLWRSFIGLRPVLATHENLGNYWGPIVGFGGLGLCHRWVSHLPHERHAFLGSPSLSMGFTGPLADPLLVPNIEQCLMARPGSSPHPKARAQS